eukprot:CAMPEP_0183478498 /NCGR_PEP_ID=MMETSP0370-20130417/170022_1 /TAXON_ID=268820 /ORGANISM="Peridinium aciculiferum, Strain PAER-2" /LENGTH=56 /DNA_ID=CAMNT_0025671459 /DNA_START=90 /DNA_END=257 /DNA_ORIENTATION=-
MHSRSGLLLVVRTAARNASAKASTSPLPLPDVASSGARCATESAPLQPARHLNMSN